MDLTRNFLTRLIDEDKLNEASRSGITAKLLDQDHLPVYNYIKRHYSEYKKVPTRDAVKAAFPNFVFGEVDEPLEYFVNAIKESYRRAVLETKLEGLASVYQTNTTRAESLLRETLSELQVTSQSFKDVNIAEQALDLVKQYDIRKTQAPEDGILSGWRSMDYMTLGWHPEEFIVLVGPKYIGKSWKMAWLAVKAMEQNERVLFTTKEMSQQAITRRIAAIYAGIKFDDLRRGELTNVQEKQFREKMEELSNSQHNLTIVRQGVSTIEDIEAKAVETDATIIFGDSIYLFPPDASSAFPGETAKRLAISQKCKATAQRLGVPFIVSVQAGRKKNKTDKPDLDDIEWSNAFSQDADTVFFLSQDELDRDIGRKRVDLLKSRDGNITDFYINQDYEYMDFTERENESSEPTTEIVIDDTEDVARFG